MQGWIRVLAEAPESDSVNSADVIHAVKAELMDELHRGQIGWNLDQNGLGVGRFNQQCVVELGTIRHACWILNRFSPAKSVTAYELVFGKDYAGSLCQFGEPVFGYAKSSAKTSAKASARWKRMVFLGKIEPQDSYLLYDGETLVLTS